MDLTKFSLYTALAIVTYLMLLAWNEDYPRLSPEPASATPAAPELPVLADASGSVTRQDAADIPTQVPDNQAQVAPTTVAPTAAPGALVPAPSSRFVSITTDTLELRIDMNGGDIVYAALPQHLRSLDDNLPFVLLQDESSRSYVAQSGLIGLNGIDTDSRAVYQSTQTSYALDENASSLDVDLKTTTSTGVTVTKRFSFRRGQYLVEVSYIVTNPTATPWQANVFGQIRRDNFPDPSDAGGMSQTFLGFATTSEDDPYIKIEFEDVDDGFAPFDMAGGWIAFSQHYFLSAWIPEPDQTHNFTTRRNSTGQYIGGFVSPAFAVPPGETVTQTIGFYAGPTDQNALAEIAPDLNLTIDYGILWFLASPIYWLLTHIEPLVGNYGLAIILLTMVVKALFYKLTETQYKSMAGMRRVMPKMQQIKESYGDDKVKLQKATMELYRKEKINPFGGCLPMLVQMPVFIALYWMLMRSVELRHAPFILWIDDLSVMDPFFVLPLLMGASMFLQTSLSPAPGDPMQAKVMKFMPVIMTVFFLWFPAGLVLYWLVNSLLGILQQWYITRKIEAAYATKNT